MDAAALQEILMGNRHAVAKRLCGRPRNIAECDLRCGELILSVS